MQTCEKLKISGPLSCIGLAMAKDDIVLSSNDWPHFMVMQIFLAGTFFLRCPYNLLS